MNTKTKKHIDEITERFSKRESEAKQTVRKCQSCGFDISEYAKGLTRCAACEDEQKAADKSAHTPGPWEAVLDTICEGLPKFAVMHPENAVCSVYTNGVDGRSEANARLIAAAPDLLQALKPFVLAIKGDVHPHATVWTVGNWNVTGQDVISGRAAIAKAEGSAQ